MISLLRQYLAFATVLWCVFGLAAPARAATIGINGSILTAFATSGDDVLVLVSSPTDLLFLGVDFDIVTPGCSDTGGLSCSLAGLTELRINMLEGDDVLELSGLPLIPGLVFTLLGGSGDDVLIGGVNSENLYGGAGDDVLIGGGGTNCASGGGGNDILIDIACDAGQEPVFPPAQPTGVPEPTAGLLLLSSLGIFALGRSRRESRSGFPSL
jgi:Ca2+-binding RTX toxin-like protein